MNSITIRSGIDKNGKRESFDSINLFKGEIYTIVGSTGSGKSRFIKDIEQLVDSDSITRRTVLIDNESIAYENRQTVSQNLIAHLSQSMKFVLDVSVKEFIDRHAACRKSTVSYDELLDLCNSITTEPVTLDSNLCDLSGGQTRALMISDIAIICNSPVVLIDEIENAGIDKIKALETLTKRDKLVIIVTHDPHTALMSNKRIVMENGAVKAIVEKSNQECILFDKLQAEYLHQMKIQSSLRKGDKLN